MKKQYKHLKKSNITKSKLILMAIIVIICITIIIYKYYKHNTNSALDNIKIDKTQITEAKTEKMLTTK